jgi:two-component system sensor histidine kinase BaeS
VDDLVAALSAQYREHNGWSFLPADADARKSWLLERWERARDVREDASATARVSPTLGFRLGLLDGNRRYLAGVVASPFMIALASIDRQGNDIVADGKIVGHLIVARPQNLDDELAVAFLIQQQENLLRAAIVALLLGALAAALLAGGFRRPIRRLVDGARRLGEGRFDTRLRVRRNDELGELAATFDQLAAKLEDAERSRRQWVADTSHELRTPLAVLRAQIEGLQDRIRAATPENIELMSRQVRSLTKLVDEL